MFREGEVAVGRDPHRSDGGERPTKRFCRGGHFVSGWKWKVTKPDPPPEEGLSSEYDLTQIRKPKQNRHSIG